MSSASRPYDLVVAGGGVMGLCAAAEAKRREPKLAVAVVDRWRAGGGASAHAPGIQIAIGRTPAERALAARGLREWRRIFTEGRWRFGRSCELFWLAHDAAGLRAMHVGPQPRDATLAVLASRLLSLPALAAPAGCSVLGDCCSYSPVELVTAALRRRLADAGCDFFEGVAARHLDSAGGAVAIHDGAGARVAGRRLIISLGPWAPGSALAIDAGLTSLRVKKVLSLHLRPSPTATCPAIAFQEDYAFLVPMPEQDYWLFSFASDDWDVEPSAGGLQVEAADLDKAVAILGKWFPGAVAQIASARVFCDCYSADAMPVVAAHPGGLPIVFLGAGSGNGFRFAPPCAQDALDLVGI